MDDYFYDEDDEYLDSFSDEELEKFYKFLTYIKYLKDIGKNVVIHEQKYAF